MRHLLPHVHLPANQNLHGILFAIFDSERVDLLELSRLLALGCCVLVESAEVVRSRPFDGYREEDPVLDRGPRPSRLPDRGFQGDGVRRD